MVQLNKQLADSNLVVALCLFIALNIIHLNSNIGICAVVQPGWVIPAKAELAIGSDLNITCTINQVVFNNNNENCTVRDMFFTVTIDGNMKIYKDYPIVERINQTSIRLIARNLEDQEGKYVCMCGSNGIFESHVFVGTLPKEVEDFSCTSYDWKYMLCNFTAPRNSIITNYNLSFENREYSSYRYYIDCNFDAAPNVLCNITGDPYKKFSEHYYFKLEISNHLGRLDQNIQVNNYERMILARPGINMLLINKTEHSVCLSWEMPIRSNIISGVLWQVHVTPDDFPTILRPMWPNNSMALRDILCLTELDYAGYNYTLDLRVRNNKTKSRWSEALHYGFRTAPALPERPPRVTDGSFYIYSSEAMLTVYWEQLEKHELNGDNFTYVISEYRVNNIPISTTKNIKVEMNSATFENWNQSAKHEIFIRSRNNVGTSKKASLLVIPPNRDTENTRAREPKNIHSVYHASNSSYSLSWKAPENSKDLINYTVFWCNSMPALQSKCKDSIHFEHVPKDRLQFTTNRAQPASLNMAVSANFPNRNTGMHWVMCTQDGTNDLAKMEPSVDEVSNFTLAVKWSTDGVCPSILRGYNLTYCERSGGKVDNCTTKHLEKNAIDYTIRDLQPYTYYSVKMLMYSDTTASKYSDELINRTGEASPTPPRQLEYSEVTSSSVQLAWKPPIRANGVVRDYKITYRHENKTDFIKVHALPDEQVDGGAEKSVNYTLRNLQAYMLYNISIQACTLYDSEPSNIISFYTAVGVPSQPILQVDNTQQSVTLEWTEPLHPSGRLEYYEVSMSEHNANNTLIGQDISYISSKQNRSCLILTPTCTSQHRFYYQVRAVNVEQLKSSAQVAAVSKGFNAAYGQRECLAQPVLNDVDKKLLLSYRNQSQYRLHKSNWATHEVSCSPDGSSVKVVMGSIEVVFALIVIIVALQLGYKKYVVMSSIGVTMPSGMVDTHKKNNSLSMSMGPDRPSGGIICTGVDTTQDTQQYVPQDTPHDFSSGNESAKLLLASNSSGSGGTERDSYEEQPVTTLPAHSSYMSMSEGLLLDDAPANDLHASRTPENTDSNGYIKPTQMKSWSTPPPMTANNANNMPTHMGMSMPLSGYVPVQVLQAARNNAPPQTNVIPHGTFTTLAPFAPMPSSNYVQASDLHKLKSFAPTPATTAFAAANMLATPTAAAATAAPTAATNVPPAANINGYTTMEQLQHFKMNAMQNPNQQTQQHNRLEPNIGGYVTPQDLNALAQNRHIL